MTDLMSLLNTLLWESVLTYLLAGVGIYLTLRTRFIQFRHFIHMFSLLKNSRKRDSAGISSFQALCTSLVSRVGAGNMTGIAIALTIGGPGAIFWMWVAAILGMSTSFIECTLAQLYKTKDVNGHYRGGPASYMEKGLGMRWMGVIFSVLLILSFAFVFNAVQANAIAQTSAAAFGFDPLYVGVFLVVVCGLVIFGGIRTIGRVAAIVVPLIASIYLLLTFWIVAHNLERIPDIFMLIMRSAFGLQEAAAGAVGYGIAQAMTQGIQRGLFSNEAGMGSAPNGVASATPYPPHPAAQGYLQMLGVFIDTIVFCSSTATIILISGIVTHPTDVISGIELTQRAFSVTVGEWGSPFFAVAIFFFGFTSIITNYAYAENNLVFLQHNHPARLTLFRLASLGMVMLGTLTELPLVWKMATISISLITITNLTAILLLSGIALKLAKNYDFQRRVGKIPTFDLVDFPELKLHLEPGIWPNSKLRG